MQLRGRQRRSRGGVLRHPKPEKAGGASGFWTRRRLCSVQSMVVAVRPTPSTAEEILAQLLQPHTPSTVSQLRLW